MKHTCSDTVVFKCAMLLFLSIIGNSEPARPRAQGHGVQPGVASLSQGRMETNNRPHSHQRTVYSFQLSSRFWTVGGSRNVLCYLILGCRWLVVLFSLKF